MALGVMAGLWPLRPRSLHADFCASDRVSEPDCPQSLLLQLRKYPTLTITLRFLPADFRPQFNRCIEPKKLPYIPARKPKISTRC
ncbi:hypothetical protein FEI14_14265 [Lacticaseibacillus zeae]|uniref:Uncharacterized protein n=1 Tax=Lacticaseibacillus zeae TaxID=57037 RepID=A0A5R8LMS5_LACZE|nr:hypothetical protein FEI14_14265 [Lacticaseibacillus zeae]